VSGARAAASLASTALLLGACAPHVTHGPAVVAGSSIGPNTGLTAASFTCYPVEYPDPMGGEPYRFVSCPEGELGPFPLLVSFSRSWEAAEGGGGFRIGADVPPWPGPEALLATQLSAYWQRPPRMEARRHGGIGVVVSAAWVAPYLQWGRAPAGERGWFTTQMVAIPHPLAGADEDFGIGWHPTLTYQSPGDARRAGFDGTGVMRYFVGAGIERSPTLEPSPSTHYWTRYLRAGMGMEIHMRR
jgi:hypothetical protein